VGEAAVRDADEAVAEGPQGLGVGVAGGAALVVAGAGAGAGGETISSEDKMNKYNDKPA